MISDPTRRVQKWLNLGRFTGVLKRVTSKGYGILAGDAGPAKVVVPVSNMADLEVGERYWYTARWLAKPRLAVAVEILRDRKS